MKKMMILAVMMVMTISATAMSYNAAKHEALFLSDKRTDMATCLASGGIVVTQTSASC